MAEITINEQILIELKRQNALLEEQLRPQREADARKKKQDEIRQSPKYLKLATQCSSLLGSSSNNAVIMKVERLMGKMLNV